MSDGGERTKYYLALAHERFSPEELLRQAVLAEEVGFDGVCCSDHFQPWWSDDTAPTNSGQAWVFLGAVAALTRRVELGPAVTGLSKRYHPALVAQAFATLARLAPGRVFVGLGSSEAMNEVPLGYEWPEPQEQVERLEEAVAMIKALFAGERVGSDGRFNFFKAREAYLYTRPNTPPPLYVSAFNEQAAEIAGRLGDGVWTLADPTQLPAVLKGYKRGCDQAGKEMGERLLHVSFSWAETDEDAYWGSREWKATLVDDYYTDDWHDPRAMQQRAEEEISDAEFKAGFIVSSDPDHHVKRVKAVEKMGATTVVLMNISGAAPEEAIRVYGKHVLPALREDALSRLREEHLVAV